MPCLDVCCFLGTLTKRWGIWLCFTAWYTPLLWLVVDRQHWSRLCTLVTFLLWHWIVLAFRTNGKNFLCHREICFLGLYNLIQENCTRKQGFHLFDSTLCWALLTFAWIALAWAKPRDSFMFRSSSNTTASSHFLVAFGAAACETSSAEAMSFLKSTVWVVFCC